MTAVGNLSASNFPYRGDLTGQTSSANPYWNGSSWTSAAADQGKMWIPIWSGEVIHAYDQFNSFEPLVTSKTIASGTTAEFPVTGTVDLNPSWDAGEELVGGADNKATTFKITLDKRPMAAHFETDNIDMMLTQWEFRSELARQAGMTLANTKDKQIFSTLVRTAASSQLNGDTEIRGDFGLESLFYDGGALSSPVSGERRLLHLGGSTVSGITSTQVEMNEAALAVLESIEKFIVHLQENDIHDRGLMCAVSPKAFMDIRALGVARDDADFAAGGRRPYFAGATEMGGLGTGLGQSLGAITDSLNYMGCTIIKSNHVLRTNQTTATMGDSKYALDFGDARVKGVIWIPDCCASIKLQGLKVDNVKDVRRNTHFTVASMMGGAGVLRPECCALLTGLDSTDSSSDTRTELRNSTHLNYTEAEYVSDGVAA